MGYFDTGYLDLFLDYDRFIDLISTLLTSSSVCEHKLKLRKRNNDLVLLGLF